MAKLKPVLIIGIQYRVKPAQHVQIVAAVGEYDVLKVPLIGWNADEQRAQAAALKGTASAVVFFAPLPIAIAYLARNSTVPLFVFCYQSDTAFSPAWRLEKI